MGQRFQLLRPVLAVAIHNGDSGHVRPPRGVDKADGDGALVPDVYAQPERLNARDDSRRKHSLWRRLSRTIVNDENFDGTGTFRHLNLDVGDEACQRFPIVEDRSHDQQTRQAIRSAKSGRCVNRHEIILAVNKSALKIRS